MACAGFCPAFGKIVDLFTISVGMRNIVFRVRGFKGNFADLFTISVGMRNVMFSVGGFKDNFRMRGTVIYNFKILSFHHVVHELP